MTATRKQIIEEARSYLGTPFHHQGRVKNHGVDCVGLVAGICKVFGLSYHDRTDYSWQPSGILPTELKKAGFIQKEDQEDPMPGDVGIFWLTQKRIIQHIAIFTDYGIIHTYADVGKVVEHVFDHKWKKRLAGIYCFPGVK